MSILSTDRPPCYRIQRGPRPLPDRALIRSLPIELQKDIGWPDAYASRATTSRSSPAS